MMGSWIKFKFNLKQFIKTIVIVTVIMCISLGVSFAFRSINFHESNIIIVFILGVLFVSRYTEGYLGGILASIMGVTLFNFFFTEPYFTLQVNRSDYPITFIIMLIAALITSTSTSIIKEKMKESKTRENNIQLLYIISQSIIKAQNSHQIVESCGKNLTDAIGKNVFICLRKDNEHWLTPTLFSTPENESLHEINQQMLTLDFENNAKSFLINNGKYYIEFINSQDTQWGVIGIEHLEAEDYTEEKKHIMKSISLQMALALERESLSKKQEEVKLTSEKERLRADLLRSISHDLRTPLTGILGSISMLIENSDSISVDVREELLKIVYDDTHWLINTVENILSMTKIDEHKVVVQLKSEIIEEIIENAITRIHRYHKEVPIRVFLPDEILLVDVDTILISQVFMNLLDNAIKYGGNTARGIDIRVSKSSPNILFEITDYGPGIPASELENIFNRFYTIGESSQSERRGIGLGLPICKSIINLHHGHIYAYNNANGGATIRFSLPEKR